MRNKIILFSLFVITGINVINAQSDSSVIFTQKQLFNILLKENPIAKQYNLLSLKAQKQILFAKGYFDPIFNSEIDQKQFEGKEYFSTIESELTIPTWYVIDVKANYSNNRGVFLNPQNRTNTNGLVTLGASANLLQGLITDQRRTALKQANNLSKQYEQEQIIALNNLFYEAIKSYWEWSNAYYKVDIYNLALLRVKERFKNTKELFILGDRPAIDTLEAYILVQDRAMQLNDATLDEQNARLALSNFLWLDSLPVILPNNVKPETLTNTLFIENLDTLNIDQTPYSIMYDYKIKNLELERKLKQEKLKPKLKLQYNFLSNANTLNNNTINPRNYKWGLDFNMPLFFRQSRAEVALANIKILETTFDWQQKRADITTKYNQAVNELINFNKQIPIIRSNVNNYQLLFNAEEEKFQLGESSIFLINSRELKWLESQIKLLDSQTKLIKNRILTRKLKGTLLEVQ
jgi:outer membrane protein TolC